MKKYIINYECREHWNPYEDWNDEEKWIVTEGQIKEFAQSWCQDGDVDAKYNELMEEVTEI